MQERPPWAAEVTTERLRVCTPPPQFSEQVPQAVQPETLQSIGQANELQVREVDKEGQAVPPYFEEVTTLRVLVFEPVPQVLVQAL